MPKANLKRTVLPLDIPLSYELNEAVRYISASGRFMLLSDPNKKYGAKRVSKAADDPAKVLEASHG